MSSRAEGVRIYIGGESRVVPFEELSVVTAPYEVDGRVVGTLGVIGPTRMAYDRMIQIVDITARLVGNALSAGARRPRLESRLPPRGAVSSVGQSRGLIILWSLVQVQHGLPLHAGSCASQRLLREFGKKTRSDCVLISARRRGVSRRGTTQTPIGCDIVIQTWNVDPNDVGSLREFATPISELPLSLAVDDLTLSKYAARSTITLLQNVLLRSGVCPGHLGLREARSLMRRHGPLAQALDVLMGPPALLRSPQERQLCRNIRTAGLALRQGFLSHAEANPFGDVLETDVRVVDFNSWAASAKLPVVGPWPTRSEVLGRMDGVSIRFPRSTTNLQALARIAWHFYPEPNRNPTSQPTKVELSAWAQKEFGVSENLSDAMSTLLRPNGASRGRPVGIGLGRSRDSR